MDVKQGGRNPQDRDRAMSYDRAMFMSILFREPYYTPIMGALNLYASARANNDISVMDTAESNFRKTCIELAKLNDKQTSWLWNYLKNYDPEAADWQVAAQVNINW